SHDQHPHGRNRMKRLFGSRAAMASLSLLGAALVYPSPALRQGPAPTPAPPPQAPPPAPPGSGTADGDGADVEEVDVQDTPPPLPPATAGITGHLLAPADGGAP